MHPLQNGSQDTNRPPRKPLSGLPGWFTESGDNNVPSYPGADWFNHVIAEFQNMLTSQGIAFDPENDDHLTQALINQYLMSVSAFSTIDDLKSGNSISGMSVDFSILASRKALVITRWRDGTDKDNGQSYAIYTSADYGGIPDGSDDFYVGGGTSYVAVSLKEAFKRVRIGTEPLPNSAAKRDAVYVGRFVKDKTDCHAFTDRTVISDVNDSGTYGAFDAVTKVEGEHSQSHIFAFQDRQICSMSGAGELGSWGGFIVWPVLAGNGSVSTRYGLWIKDVSNPGGGQVGSQLGIFIEDLNEANSNVAINLQQKTGYSVYAPNAGQWLIGGDAVLESKVNFNGVLIAAEKCFFGAEVKFGGLTNATLPIAGVALTIEKDGLPTRGFLDVNSAGASFGVEGDKALQFTSNATAVVVIEDSSGGNALRPASTSQNLGTAGKPWNQVKSKELNMIPITAATASNLSFFVDSADGKAKFKDATGTVNLLY